MRALALAVLALLAAAAPPRLTATECRGSACEEDEAGLLQTGSWGLAGGRGGGAQPTTPTVESTAVDASARRAAAEEATAAFEAAFQRKSSGQAVLEFAPDDIEKALVVGTTGNIGTSVPNFASVMDLTGLWYIKWSPWSQADPAVLAYKKARMEIAVTFADSTVSGYSSPDNPFTLSVFGQKAQHWAYSDSLLAEGQMFAHSTQWDYCHPLSFEMKNNREGAISGVGPFTYLDEDQWERPTDTAVGTFTYKLSRIVYANGTKTKHYHNYATLMKGYKLRVWGGDDQLARCEATAPFSYLCYAFHDLGGCAS